MTLPKVWLINDNTGNQRVPIFTWGEFVGANWQWGKLTKLYSVPLGYDTIDFNTTLITGKIHIR